MGFFAFLILVGICLFTPVFDISGISVTGNKILSSEDVIKASGIKIGDSFIYPIECEKFEDFLKRS